MGIRLGVTHSDRVPAPLPRLVIVDDHAGFGEVLILLGLGIEAKNLTPAKLMVEPKKDTINKNNK